MRIAVQDATRSPPEGPQHAARHIAIVPAVATRVPPRSLLPRAGGRVATVSLLGQDVVEDRVLRPLLPFVGLVRRRGLRRRRAAAAAAAADLRRHLLAPRLCALVLRRRAADRDAQRSALPLCLVRARLRLPLTAIRLSVADGGEQPWGHHLGVVVPHQPLTTHGHNHVALREPRRRELVAHRAEPQRALVRALEDQAACAAR